MHRNWVVLAGVAVVLIGFIVAGRLALGAVAQDGTPSAQPAVGSDRPEGVSAKRLASAKTVEKLPPRRASVAMTRIRVEPGATWEVPPDDPSTTLLYLQSGTLTVRSGAPLTVDRAGRGGEEEIAADVESTFEQDDSVLVPPSVAVTARNDGDGPAVILSVTIAPLGESSNDDAAENDTPTP